MPDDGAFTRYALYFVPPLDAEWARFCTGWLGWDMAARCAVRHPDIDGLAVAEITAAPRRYGLHATLKPPFRLAEGGDRGDLENACEALAAGLAPVDAGALALMPMGRFLALRPVGDEASLVALASRCVRDLDRFRAAPTPAEIAARMRPGLSPGQADNLHRWGYAFVHEAFRFHITLTGPLDRATRDRVAAGLSRHLTPLLPERLRINALALVGEATDGRFHLLRRFALAG
jgi:putative phosphonate metabolism protein